MGTMRGQSSGKPYTKGKKLFLLALWRKKIGQSLSFWLWNGIPCCKVRMAAVRDGHTAVVPVVPLVDTIRTVSGDAPLGTTVSRDSLRAVQTPQGFTRDVLQRAHAEVDAPVTDDAEMVERLGIAVQAVDGHEDAFKVTRPLDVVLAEALIEHRRTR